MKPWGRSDCENVHELLEAAHISVFHGAHILTNKKYVLFIKEISCFRATCAGLADSVLKAALTPKTCLANCQQHYGKAIVSGILLLDQYTSSWKWLYHHEELYRL